MKLMFVGEAWGDGEERIKRPLVGPSGIFLLEMMHIVGLISLTEEDRACISAFYRFGRDPSHVAEIWDRHNEFYLTNVFNLQPKPKNDIANLCGPSSLGIAGFPRLSNGKYVRAEYTPHLERLFREIDSVRPNLIVALGATPSWALLKTSGIKRHRGTTAIGYAGFKVLPIYHPAAILREYSLRPVFMADLDKAKRECEFPDLRRPQREFWLRPSLDDLAAFEPHIMASRQLSVDIETWAGQITCIGFSPSPDRALVIPFAWRSSSDGNYWPTKADELRAWDYVERWCNLPHTQIVGQNFLYDLQYLWKVMGIPVRSFANDTMLQHHALQPELEKSLGFLGSLYTDEPAWKFMRKAATLKKED